MGMSVIPFNYVIRHGSPEGWNPIIDAISDYEWLMYQVRLNGTNSTSITGLPT